MEHRNPSIPDRRLMRVGRQSLSALLIRGGALIVSFLHTPALIRYFDGEVMPGVWYTLLSLLLWLLNLDLGVSSALRTYLTRAVASGDDEEIRRTLSAGVGALGGLTLLLSALGILFVSLGDLYVLFGIDRATVPPEKLTLSAALILGGILLRFFLGSVTAALYALQYAAVNHALTLSASIMQLLYVLVASPSDPADGLVRLAVVYALSINLPLLAAGGALLLTRLRTYRPHPAFIDRPHLRRMLGIGASYFACQLLYAILVNTDMLFISAIFGAAETTPYAIGHKLTATVATVLVPVLSPVWSAVTHADARRDMAYLRLTRRRLCRVMLAAVGLQIVVALLWPVALRLWLGADIPSRVAEPATAILFAIYGSVFCTATVLSTMACGLGRMRRQLVCYLIGAVIKPVGIRVLAPAAGDWRLVVVCSTAALVPYCVVEGIFLWRMFRESASDDHA